MLYEDIALVARMVHTYGHNPPMVDLGGQAQPIIANYKAENLSKRFFKLKERPFDRIDPTYRIYNPELGDPLIEEMTERDVFGTVICTSVVEHTINPFAVFAGLARVTAPNGMILVTTVFAYPEHGEHDWWRFSGDCLAHLAENAGLAVEESGTYLELERITTLAGKVGNLIATYVMARKG